MTTKRDQNNNFKNIAKWVNDNQKEVEKQKKKVIKDMKHINKLQNIKNILILNLIKKYNITPQF
ncbi:hypothetical protein [Spiroplasma endosymbiont of Virgichneumon dumeticola]|uniref:hypothetical protein n=1 Tax=Spiroplasma endosymbiont of Virgichneumon dumeticola TaxID=3139323 RepID=UPI0035C8C27D